MAAWDSAGRRTVTVLPADPAWPARFQRIADSIRSAVGGPAPVLHHSGSTSVPGLAAKPVIDILGVVPQIASLDQHAAALKALGFEARGEYGIRGRRYFSRPARRDDLKVHLHGFEQGHPDVERHLAFRDYLRAHPAVTAKYATLKAQLAEEWVHDPERYQAGKSEFCTKTNRAAAAWRLSEAGGAGPA